MPSSGDDVAQDDEIAVLQTATRDLVGVALRSLEALDGAVSLPQFRLLSVLHELGTVPSSHVAAALGVGASSVTRLADRLLATGQLRRGEDPTNRSIVTLELTDRGRGLVEAVLARRQAELAHLIGQLSPAERAALTGSLRRLHHVARATPVDGLGPLPL